MASFESASPSSYRHKATLARPNTLSDKTTIAKKVYAQIAALIQQVNAITIAYVSKIINFGIDVDGSFTVAQWNQMA